MLAALSYNISIVHPPFLFSLFKHLMILLPLKPRVGLCSTDLAGSMLPGASHAFMAVKKHFSDGTLSVLLALGSSLLPLFLSLPLFLKFSNGEPINCLQQCGSICSYSDFSI